MRRDGPWCPPSMVGSSWNSYRKDAADCARVVYAYNRTSSICLYVRLRTQSAALINSRLSRSMKSERSLSLVAGLPSGMAHFTATIQM